MFSHLPHQQLPMPPTYMPHPPMGFGMPHGLPTMPPPSTGGGLLARLFGKGAANSAFGMGPQMAGAMNPLMGATASSSSGGTSLLGIINNIQRVLGIAQNVGPMIQQYGPLIRSAPALYRMFRNNSSTSDSTETTTTAETTGATSITPISKTNEQTDLIIPKEKVKVKKTTIDGIPAPKLYI